MVPHLRCAVCNSGEGSPAPPSHPPPAHKWGPTTITARHCFLPTPRPATVLDVFLPLFPRSTIHHHAFLSTRGTRDGPVPPPLCSLQQYRSAYSSTIPSSSRTYRTGDPSPSPLAIFSSHPTPTHPPQSSLFPFHSSPDPPSILMVSGPPVHLRLLVDKKRCPKIRQRGPRGWQECHRHNI